MSDHSRENTRPFLRGYLTAGYVMFIAYLSLTPITSWQEQGLSFIDTLTAPLERSFTLFDFVLNLFSYLLLGILIASMLHRRRSRRTVIIISTLCGLLLSASMEYLQLYLPSRFSSNTDMLSNTLGTFIGALTYFYLARHAWNKKIQAIHTHWFMLGRTQDFGLALIALWLFAQINPSLPMLGSVFIRDVARWPFDIVPAQPFNWLECAEVTLNLLLAGILLSTLLRNRNLTTIALALMLGVLMLVKFIAAAILLKSWALLVWLDSEAILGMVSGIFLLIGLLKLSRNGLLLAGTASALLYLVLLQDVLMWNNYTVARRIYHWHYIHLLNYNGFSQLAILLFPVFFLLYLWRTGVLRK